jgi:hypothetical protein
MIFLRLYRGGVVESVLGLVLVWGENGVEFTLSREEFLTLYDTCNSFLCDINDSKVKDLVKMSIKCAEEPMRSVWASRAEHHIYLIIDGLCKLRCLFEDYDSCFVANDLDYERAEALILNMISAWNMPLSIK